MDSPRSDSPPDRKRVLVVDDNDLVSLMLCACFEALGWQAARAERGEVALERLRTEPPFDLVLLDVWMPGMNGLDVLRTMRAFGIATPVLMVTAYDGSLDRRHALDLGASDVLLKPFDADVLTDRAAQIVA